jgi:hypothetical protein
MACQYNSPKRIRSSLISFNLHGAVMKKENEEKENA